MQTETKKAILMTIGILASITVAISPEDVAMVFGADTEYVKTLFRIFIALITGLSSATGIAFLKK